mgnify:CR=1 FL=1
MDRMHILIIGGGGTGGALAHDLVLRGFDVTLVERGEVTSGTTGRHHGLLHSGARYAVKDHESARECIEENTILRKIAPGSFEENDGLFVAVNDEDVEYSRLFLEGCAETDIPTRTLTREQALRLEPNLSPKTIMAVQIPDATMDAMRMPLRFFATAKKNGAKILPFTEVISIERNGDVIKSVKVRDNRSNKEYEIKADLIVNAAGPWCGKLAEMANVNVPIRPSPGVMVAVRGRLANMVINRMTPSGDGDIIVPQRGLSVIGTSSWVVDDPDKLGLPQEHIDKMYHEGAQMMPIIANAPLRAAWSAARPLIGDDGADSGRELSRTFKCFDHANQGVNNFVTITGGKATTLRGMAEATANVVCEKVGSDAQCKTREVVLLPHQAYYK